MIPAMFRGRFALLTLTVVLARAAPACLDSAGSGTKLNPQPLPPVDGDRETNDNKTPGATGGSAAPGTDDAGALPTDAGSDSGDARLD